MKAVEEWSQEEKQSALFAMERRMALRYKVGRVLVWFFAVTGALIGIGGGLRWVIIQIAFSVALVKKTEWVRYLLATLAVIDLVACMAGFENLASLNGASLIWLISFTLYSMSRSFLLFFSKSITEYMDS